ncbi:hypothetical protein H9P43_010029 [Blastocladiella emersonii ATCC 22665]|nr:hypothetical protein H9P43_010029 [Blastocladiella emersonii ATCC 22665]
MKGIRKLTKVISNSVYRVDEEEEQAEFFSTHPSYSVTQLSTSGFSGELTCTACDPALGILAIGTRAGIINVLGKDSLELALPLPHPDATPTNARPAPSATLAAPLPSKGILKSSMEGLVAEPKLLVLQTGTAQLAVVDSLNRLCIFDLTVGECVYHARVVEGQVFTMEAAPGSPWLYLGCKNGRVAVFSIDKRWMSTYLISSQAALPMVPVVALQVHPFQTNELLIVYYDGSVVVWDLVARKAVARPTPVHWPTLTPSFTSPTHATTGCWHPDGGQIVVGFDNGWVAVWSVTSASGTAGAVFPVAAVDDPDPNDSPCPVFKLIWALETRASPAPAGQSPPAKVERATLYVGGGLSDHALTRLEFPRSKPVTTKPAVHVIRHSPVFGLVSDFLLFSASPWQPLNPRAVLAISDRGVCMAYDVSQSPPQLRQYGLPLPLTLASMGRVHSLAQSRVAPPAMNEIMGLQRQCSRLISGLPLDWSRTSGSVDPPTGPDVRLPEHALLTLLTDSGVHVLDLTSSPPTVLPGLFVPFELIKSIIIDHLPASIIDDPTALAEWHPGLSLAWVQVDWAQQRMVLGCANGLVVEMLCRKSMLAGTFEDGRERRVRMRSLDDLGPDGSLLDSKPDHRRGSLFNSAPASPARSPTGKSEDGSGAGGDTSTTASPTSATPDGPTWIPLALSMVQFRAFEERVFLPFKIMLPPRPTRAARGALYDATLAIASTSGAVDVFDLRTESYVTRIDLAPACEEIAADLAAEAAKRAGGKLLSRYRSHTTVVDTDGGGGGGGGFAVTALRWHRGLDGTLLLFVGCSGHVFVYELEDETVSLRTCLLDKGDVPVLEVLCVPDAVAAEEQVMTLPRRLNVSSPSVKADDDDEGKHPPPMGRIPLSGSNGTGPISDPGSPIPLDPTVAIVTRDSIRVLDLDDFAKLHSWKPTLERHGHIVTTQLLNHSDHATSPGPNRTRTARAAKGGGDTEEPLPVLMVVTDTAVVMLTYPYLELVTDMSHGVRGGGAPDPDRLAITGDAHLVHVEGENRMHVVACRRDTAWAVHPALSFDLGGGELAAGAATPAGVDRRPTLVPLPPRPAPPATSMLGSLMSYLPGFGSGAASPEASPASPDVDRQLDEAFGNVNAAALGAGHAVNEAMDALRKRGEKLEQLEEKFSQLNEGASSFAATAKAIREREEKKKWYQF